MQERVIDVPCWKCECGRHDSCRTEDVIVRVGNAVFRKPGCGDCKRPMMMACDNDPDGVGSPVRRSPGPQTPAVALAVPV